MFKLQEEKEIMTYSLIICINDSYVMPAIIMVNSFHYHHKKDDIDLLVLHSGLSKEKIIELNNRIGKFCTIKYINCGEFFFEYMPPKLFEANSLGRNLF